MVWIRVAESDRNDGQEGSHLDIDVCNLGGGGVFLPMEARARPCPGGRIWGVWWHESPDLAYANRADSAPCELRVGVEGTTLVGSFTCKDLVLDDGTASVDLLDGRFEFVLEGR